MSSIAGRLRASSPAALFLLGSSQASTGELGGKEVGGKLCVVKGRFVYWVRDLSFSPVSTI